MTRPNFIPDNYVGDVHLTNWFKKHLQMDKLDRVYINSKEENRTSLTKQGFRLFPDSWLYLLFNNGKVVVMNSSSYTNFIDYSI